MIIIMVMLLLKVTKLTLIIKNGLSCIFFNVRGTTEKSKFITS